ncbi:hypothetical protein NP493_303g02003 [Ridgeia piscesae]|uniref:Uncharacterized protein n=1 Tax=Ridgeia piscesae TaxID=27915 RepID=A0AAD9L5L0_RIDPI|nr:hypothetical protein NP493_303g02003 [Ridgeia piscesae]
MYNLVVLLLVLATYGWTDALFFASDCNGIKYDDNRYLCCSDVLYVQSTYVRCCYGEIIDTRLHFCAFGKVINPFNRTTFTCRHFAFPTFDPFLQTFVVRKQLAAIRP